MFPTIEEYLLRSEVITTCHSPRTDEDKAYEDLGHAVGSANFERIWGELNLADPTDIAANGYRAQEIFRQRLLQAAEDAKKQVKKKAAPKWSG